MGKQASEERENEGQNVFKWMNPHIDNEKF